MKKKFIYLILAIYSLVSTVAISETQKSTVLILGDSLSAAYNLAIEDGWANLMQQKIDSKGLPYRILNESISGDTSGNGLYRMKEIVKREKFSHLILALGANDGLRGYPFEQLKENLLAIINLAREQNAKVVLIGIDLPSNYGAFYKNNFDAVYTDLEKEEKLPLLKDLLIDVPKEEGYFLEDRLHPNAKAQPIIMESVWALVGKYL